MITKEEIEKAKERFNKSLAIEKYTKNIGTPVYISDIQVLLEYIEHLENEQKK